MLLLTGLAPARAQRRPWPAARLPRPVPKVLLRLELRVLVTSEGDPVPHAFVTLSPASGGRRPGLPLRADQHGQVRLFNVLRGHYRLSAWADRQRDASRGLLGAETELLVLPTDSARQDVRIVLPVRLDYENRGCRAPELAVFCTEPLGTSLPPAFRRLDDVALATYARQHPTDAPALLAHLPAVQPLVLAPLSGDVALRLDGLDPHLTPPDGDWLRGWAGQLGRWQRPALGLGRVYLPRNYGFADHGPYAPGRAPAATNTRELTALGSLSSRGETSVQAFGYRGRPERGLSLFAAATERPATGGAAGQVGVPAVRQVLLRPALLFQPNEQFSGTVDYELNYQRRAGYWRPPGPAEAPYAARSRQWRHTGAYQLGWQAPDEWPLPRYAEAGGSFSAFSRHDEESGFRFAGRQTSLQQSLATDWQAGDHGSRYLRLSGQLASERFRPLDADRARLGYHYRQQHYAATYYWQGDLRPSYDCAALSAVAELRLAHHNVFGTYWLPRAVVAWQPRKDGRLGPVQLSAARDVRVPNPFDAYVPDDARTSPHLLFRQPVPAGTRAERLWRLALGGRYRLQSLRYRGFLAHELSYTAVRQPLVQRAAVLDGQYGTYLLNADYRLRSYASHTYLELQRGPTRLLAYYGFSYVRRRGADYLPFSPRHRASAELSRQLRRPWRLQASARWVAGQVGYDNAPLPAYCLLGTSCEYRLGQQQRTILTLTADNLLNVRQRQYALVPTGQPDAPPAFQPLWGPQLGRVLTLSVQYTLPKNN